MQLSRLRSFLPSLFIVCFSCCLCSASESPRQRLKFDFDWRFQLGEVENGQSPQLDDSKWRQLHVPHDWSAEHSFSQDYASGTGYLPGGIGWYRKTFEIPSNWKGREVQIYFDGVYRNSTVWVNGHKLGERPYGYAPFFYRLTPHLKFGTQNVIAVRVAREEVADSRWYTGSGIYRHVWLSVTSPIHVQQWGTFVTTPRVTDKRADVNVSNEVVNRTEAEVEVRVETEILDPAGKSVSKQSTIETVAAGATQTFAQWHIAKKPSRWSTESPTLYSAVTRVFHGDALVDEKSTAFGIRTYHFDANKGFFLNGKPLLIKGLCTHHDAGVVGAAVPDKVLERRLRNVKQLGANAIRCSHNPMADELYTLCDQLGLLVMDEAFDEWELGKRKWVEGRNVGKAKRFGYNEHFEQWAERDVAAMVRRGRNHPSIILWSIGNEIDYPGDPYVHPELFDPAAPPPDPGSPRATRLAVVAPSLIAAVKRHDPTRPVTMALSNLPTSNGVGLASMLDVAGYNYQEKFYKQDHHDFPGRVIYGSENGKDLGKWRAVVKNDFISSIYLWAGFDFLGEAGRWPNHGSESGVFDTRGFLKPYGWLQQALWSEEPMVRIQIAEKDTGERGWHLRKHPHLWKAKRGKPLHVLITTNCDKVQLELNGNPMEVKHFRGGAYYRAELPFEPGEMIATGLNEGQVVATDSLKTPGPAKKLQLIADREVLRADGQDVVHYEANIVDANGTVIGDIDVEVTVEVSGAGRLLGVDNGDQNDTTDLQSPIKQTRDGRLLIIVQSDRAPGEIDVKVTASGLPTAATSIATK